MTEEWRAVVDCEGWYEVSDQGRVRSLDRVTHRRSASGALYTVRLNGRILKQSGKGDGYPGVQLYGGFDRGTPRNRRQVYVHILVCEAFHGPRPDGMEVAHGDGDKMNAAAANLRWATKLENYADKKLHGTAMTADRSPGAKLSWDLVNEIRSLSNVKRKELAARYEVSASTIRSIINGRSWVP